MKFQIWTIDGNFVRALSSNSRNRRFYSTGVQTFFSIPLMAIGIEMEITFHIDPYAKLSLFCAFVSYCKCLLFKTNVRKKKEYKFFRCKNHWYQYQVPLVLVSNVLYLQSHISTCVRTCAWARQRAGIEEKTSKPSQLKQQAHFLF